MRSLIVAVYRINETEKTETIWDFVAERNVFTLATSAGEQPYCTPCFYAFDLKGKQLIFKSNEDTRHRKELDNNNRVGGSILPEKLAVGQVKGLQFSGTCDRIKDRPDQDKLNAIYYEEFPFARAMGGELWVVILKEVKLTDSKLGFGKKLKWQRP